VFDQKMADNFSTEIMKIVAQNPNGPVRICLGDHAVTIQNSAVLGLLSSRRVQNPNARIFIVDAYGRPADLGIKELYASEWNTGVGGTAQWAWASTVNTRFPLLSKTILPQHPVADGLKPFGLDMANYAIIPPVDADKLLPNTLLGMALRPPKTK
jgi:hypothetical protein